MRGGRFRRRAIAAATVQPQDQAHRDSDEHSDGNGIATHGGTLGTTTPRRIDHFC
jgi:hypothetical protein